MMLKSLSTVKGYDAFIEYVSKRMSDHTDCLAEIKGLFEINKSHHPLIEICSQNKSEPEGIFRMNDMKGLIEVAHVKYIFTASHEIKKLTNKLKNTLMPFNNLLLGKYKDYVISIIVISSDFRPTEEELGECKKTIVDFIKNGDDRLIVQYKFGLLVISPFDNNLSINPDPEIICKLKSAGLITQAPNVDINKKIKQLIKDKKRQHKAKYLDSIKIYYFVVNSPMHHLQFVDPLELTPFIKGKEILIVTTFSGPAKLIVYGNDININEFDFSNRFDDKDSRTGR